MQQSDLLRNWIYTTFSEIPKRRRREEGGEREGERQTEKERQTAVQTSKLLIADGFSESDNDFKNKILKMKKAEI